MRIGHLIQHDDGPRGVAFQHLVEENIVERLAFQHQSLMRRVMRHHPAQIRCLRIFHRKISG